VSRRASWSFVLVALGALVLWVLPRERSGREAGPSLPAARPSPSAPPPSAVPVPVPAFRNVFRFGDEGPDDAGSGPGRLAARPAEPLPGPTPEAGPRLVGVVRRGGRALAALAEGGEVELAGPGESAAGVVVVAIGDDGVRIRRPDGSETVIPLP
jgi:hypothetical protein